MDDHIECLIGVMAQALILVLAMLDVLASIEPFVDTLIKSFKPHEHILDLVKT